MNFLQKIRHEVQAAEVNFSKIINHIKEGTENVDIVLLIDKEIVFQSNFRCRDPHKFDLELHQLVVKYNKK